MYRKLKLILISSSLFIFTACSSHVTKKNVQLPVAKKYAIASFMNYTETPMAGLRAASIVEGVLAKKHINLYSLIEKADETDENNNKSSLLNTQATQAKAIGADYLITGEVQEWRYKTGIDGEPVVSYTLKIIDLKTQQVSFSGVGAKSGWGHKSIGVVAQEIAGELVPKFVP